MSELAAITGGKQPAVLTVMADEEVTGSGEPPAMSAVADLVLVLDDAVNSPPYFHNAKYVRAHRRITVEHRIYGAQLFRYSRYSDEKKKRE